MAICSNSIKVNPLPFVVFRPHSTYSAGYTRSQKQHIMHLFSRLKNLPAPTEGVGAGSSKSLRIFPPQLMDCINEIRQRNGASFLRHRFSSDPILPRNNYLVVIHRYIEEYVATDPTFTHHKFSSRLSPIEQEHPLTSFRFRPLRNYSAGTKTCAEALNGMQETKDEAIIQRGNKLYQETLLFGRPISFK
jgi:hypothetical protein